MDHIRIREVLEKTRSRSDHPIHKVGVVGIPEKNEGFLMTNCNVEIGDGMPSIHAEMALFLSYGPMIEIYVTHPPCSRCVVPMIFMKVKSVWVLRDTVEGLNPEAVVFMDKWGEDCEKAKNFLLSKGVEYNYF